MNFDTIKKIVEDAHNNKVFTMIISGGDPLLHPHIYEIIEMLNKYKILPLLGITGVGVTKEQVLKLKALGIEYLQVSLDGATENSNREMRGALVYQSVLDGIKLMQHEGIKVNMAACVNKNNYNELKDILNLAKILDMYKVKVAFWSKIPEDSMCEDLSLGEKEKKDILSMCASFNATYEKEWISIPGYNLTSMKPLSKLKYPHLVIGADGHVSIGELGSIIGHVDNEPISISYQKFVINAKERFINKTINRI